jgi:hypothetical protein
MREGVTSRAYIDFDASSATTTSMPRRLVTSAFSPHCGWASAMAKHTSARVVAELDTAGRVFDTPGASTAASLTGTARASRLPRRSRHGHQHRAQGQKDQHAGQKPRLREAQLVAEQGEAPRGHGNTRSTVVRSSSSSSSSANAATSRYS